MYVRTYHTYVSDVLLSGGGFGLFLFLSLRRMGNNHVLFAS